MLDQASELRNLLRSNEVEPNTNSKVISISSGKGGVGKSNFVANLAITFAKHEKKVVIIDADLGLANIEVLFGVIPKRNLRHVLNNEFTINECLSEGPLGIKFLSAGSGLNAMPELTESQQTRLLNSFKYLDEQFDIILVDNGAGINSTVINFMKSSDDIIVLTTPEPTSITDAYALIKIASDNIENRVFNLIVNQANNLEESKEVHNKLQIVSSRFLGIDINYFGFLPYDNNLKNAVKMQNPVALSYPNSKYCKILDLLCMKLLNENSKKAENGKSFAKKFVGFFKRN